MTGWLLVGNPPSKDASERVSGAFEDHQWIRAQNSLHRARLIVASYGGGEIQQEDSVQESEYVSYLVDPICML
jgi:hypothetical protein